MLKIFISHPMNGRTDEEIKNERQKVCNLLKQRLKEDFEIIDSFFENAPHDAKPLWYLGESIKLMSEADLIVFVGNWANYRGCKIEYHCAQEYKKMSMFLTKKDME